MNYLRLRRLPLKWVGVDATVRRSTLQCVWYGNCFDLLSTVGSFAALPSEGRPLYIDASVFTSRAFATGYGKMARHCGNAARVVTLRCVNTESHWISYPCFIFETNYLNSLAYTWRTEVRVV